MWKVVFVRVNNTTIICEGFISWSDAFDFSVAVDGPFEWNNVQILAPDETVEYERHFREES